jgi:uncharacterized damage-inducible protein DinB
MVTLFAARPEPSEYAPFYHGYIVALPERPVLEILEAELPAALALWESVGDEGADRRYAPGKWTIREVAGHVVDVERIMATRALRIARGDRTPLPGFEENDYVKIAAFGSRPLASIVEEFRHLRAANLALFRSLDEAAWQRRGIANGQEVSVRALAHIIAGHELHHRRILLERYLSPAGESRQ